MSEILTSQGTTSAPNAHLNNAILSPFSIRNSDGHPITNKHPNVRKLTSCGIYDRAGRLEVLSERIGATGGDHVISISPQIWMEDASQYERICGKSVFLGHLHWHYGHFITEGISRLWFSDKMEKFDHYIYTPFFGKETHLLNFHLFFLKKLGIDPSKVIILSNGARLDDIFIPGQLWSINMAPMPYLGEIYRLIKGQDDCKNRNRYFLSRKQSEFRRVTNVRDVETLFRKYEFEIIYPEDLKIADQISIYGSGCLLSGFPGTALHNILFSPPGTKLLEIGDTRNPRSFHVMQKYCNEMSKANAKRIDFYGLDANIDIDYLSGCIDDLRWFWI